MLSLSGLTKRKMKKKMMMTSCLKIQGWKASSLSGSPLSSGPTLRFPSHGCHLRPLGCCTRTCPECKKDLKARSLSVANQTSGSRSVIQLDLRVPPNRKGKTQGLPWPGPPGQLGFSQDNCWQTIFKTPINIKKKHCQNFWNRTDSEKTKYFALSDVVSIAKTIFEIMYLFKCNC